MLSITARYHQHGGMEENSMPSNLKAKLSSTLLEANNVAVTAMTFTRNTNNPLQGDEGWGEGIGRKGFDPDV